MSALIVQQAHFALVDSAYSALLGHTTPCRPWRLPLHVRSVHCIPQLARAARRTSASAFATQDLQGSCLQTVMCRASALRVLALTPHSRFFAVLNADLAHSNQPSAILAALHALWITQLRQHWHRRLRMHVRAGASNALPNILNPSFVL